jgi:hypothetical protein
VRKRTRTDTSFATSWYTRDDDMMDDDEVEEEDISYHDKNDIVTPQSYLQHGTQARGAWQTNGRARRMSWQVFSDERGDVSPLATGVSWRRCRSSHGFGLQRGTWSMGF